MWLLIAGLVVFVVPGTWVLRRARHEFASQRRLSTGSVVAVFVAYVGHATVTLLAAWQSTWLLPVGPGAAHWSGGLLVVFATAVYVTARLQFRSFRLTWGLETNRLVTNGIYWFSRNPQTLGALLFLAGASLVGRSAVALLLTAFLWVASLIWLPVEERVLGRLFGEEYQRYRVRTPRFLGIPKT